jgi:hypothetical protein
MMRSSPATPSGRDRRAGASRKGRFFLIVSSTPPPRWGLRGAWRSKGGVYRETNFNRSGGCGMDSQPNQRKTIGFKTKCLSILFLFPIACGIIFVRSYDETVSRWKSYKDLERWMEKDFSFDTERFKRFEGTLPPPRTPEETFKLKSGIYIDAVIFAKEALNRIDPTYRAQIVVLLIGRGANHYVCSFKRDGRIFVMDYGTPYRTLVGVHGPFNSLEEYKVFFEKNHPTIKSVQAITYLR